jgi:hypothetical protein
MRSDSEIQVDVTRELKWDPRLQDDDIAVGVRGGVVTLGGFAKSYSDKVTAEQVISHVPGVQAIANDIAVRLPSAGARPDPEVARAGSSSAGRWNGTTRRRKRSVPSGCCRASGA